MKNGAFFSAIALGVTLGALGCGAPPPVAVAPPPPPSAEPGPPPPPPPSAPPSIQTKLIGLPLSGSQIDVLGDIEFDTNQATIRNTPASQVVLNTLLAAGKQYSNITKLR